MGYSPTPKRGSRFALLLLLLGESFLHFHPQVWSITLLLPERVLPTPTAKVKRKIDSTKKKRKNLTFSEFCHDSAEITSFFCIRCSKM